MTSASRLAEFSGNFGLQIAKTIHNTPGQDDLEATGCRNCRWMSTVVAVAQRLLKADCDHHGLSRQVIYRKWRIEKAI